jgi:hypothetical protein
MRHLMKSLIGLVGRIVAVVFVYSGLSILTWPWLDGLQEPWNHVVGAGIWLPLVVCVGIMVRRFVINVRSN